MTLQRFSCFSYTTISTLAWYLKKSLIKSELSSLVQVLQNVIRFEFNPSCFNRKILTVRFGEVILVSISGYAFLFRNCHLQCVCKKTDSGSINRRLMLKIVRIRSMVFNNFKKHFLNLYLKDFNFQDHPFRFPLVTLTFVWLVPVQCSISRQAQTRRQSHYTT